MPQCFNCALELDPEPEIAYIAQVLKDDNAPLVNEEGEPMFAAYCEECARNLGIPGIETGRNLGPAN